MPHTPSNPAGPFVLPARLLWLYAIGPILLAPTVVPNFLVRPRAQQLSIVASFYLAFFALGAVLRLAYARLQPRWLHRERGLGPQLLAHGLFCAGVIIPAALALQPIYCLVNHGTPTATERTQCLVGLTPLQRFEFVWIALVVSWGHVLPAVMLHGLRLQRDAAERRLQEERTSRLAAQLRALQARVQPHFLFNSLNTAAELIHEDPFAAERMLTRLAELLRYGLKDPEQRLGRLADEVAVVRAYLEVQAARFGDRLRFSIECPDDLANASVPPLCLQPLVENAVVHGAVSQRRGGEVRVHAEAVGSQLCLTVRDDGPGYGASAHRGNGLALRELRERLVILYPGATPPAELRIETSEGRGCQVSLHLPLANGPSIDAPCLQPPS